MIRLQVIDQSMPPGLVDENGELCHHKGEDYLFQNGQRLTYDQFPEALYSKIDFTISLRPRSVWALNHIGLTNIHSRRRQFLRCNNSSFDYIPDVCADVPTLRTEYVPCSIRGKCKYEGKLCQGVFVLNGKLTLRELRVMALIRIGLYDKEICDQLFISLDTLKTHKKNIQRKLGVERKSAIANSAAFMQII